MARSTRPARRFARALAPLVLAALTVAAAPASACGPYGHQQIYRRAIELLGDAPLARWLRRNDEAGRHYSMSPDIDWQPFGAPPSDPELRVRQLAIGRREATTHRFNAEALADRKATDPLRASQFPHTASYAEAVPALARALGRNASRYRDITALADVHWNPADLSDLEKLGTVPWRILQLHELATGSLAAGDEPRALVYLAALSHYVGDLAVPFHSSVFFDGFPGLTPPGVHRAFELDGLEAEVTRRTGAVKDARTQLWSDFRATEALLRHLARPGPLAPLAHEDAIAEILFVATSGERYVAPLSRAWRDAVQREALPRDRWLRFMQSSARFPGGAEVPVFSIALWRLAEAARLTARLWASAWAEARRRRPALREPRALLHYAQATAIRLYPEPDYLDAAASCVPRLAGAPLLSPGGGAGPASGW